MNLFLFFTIILISLIVVRIGAVAFHITGIEWSLAKFQALSCFTGTGFTTSEAELIVGNPQRRKIATVLMVLGNAGLVVMIATFANSVRPPDVLAEIEIPYLHLIISNRYFPWIKLGLIIVVIFLVYLIVTKTRLIERISERVGKRLRKKAIVTPVSYEEIVIATGGYGLLNVTVEPRSHVVGKTILESGLRERGIIVLMIERGVEHFPVPGYDTKIEAGDVLACFGQLEKAKDVLMADK